MRRLILTLALMTAAQAATAQITEFDFRGNAGFGLLPGNEVGMNIPIAADGTVLSTASGGEVDGGLVFDASTNELSIAFDFEGLNGGLLDAASGIHLHLPGVLGDPFNQTGPIVFNLNSGADPAVTNNNTLLVPGPTVTSGAVDAVIDFDNAVLAAGQTVEGLVQNLFDGEFYLNIHSADFGGGELRGTLVAVPEPATLGLLGLVAAGLGLSPRRR